MRTQPGAGRSQTIDNGRRSPLCATWSNYISAVYGYTTSNSSTQAPPLAVTLTMTTFLHLTFQKTISWQYQNQPWTPGHSGKIWCNFDLCLEIQFFLPSPKLPTRHYWESLRPSETTPTLPRQHPPRSNKNLPDNPPGALSDNFWFSAKNALTVTLPKTFLARCDRHSRTVFYHAVPGLSKTISHECIPID